METARGRWFLREYTRRARAADTGKLLEALSRIERAVTGQAALPGGFSPEHHAQALDERQSRFAEIAWTLRERGYEGSICALIENEARALARLAENIRGDGPMVDGEAAPERTAIAAPVTAAVAPVEAPAPKLSPMVAPKLDTPVAPPQPVIMAPPPTPVRAPTPGPVRRFEALGELDRLAPREKARLFA